MSVVLIGDEGGGIVPSIYNLLFKALILIQM